MAGASLDHIRRVGRWNSEAIENSYLTCFPRQAMIIIHGFPKERGCFWLPRALVVPPLSLQRMIFPELEDNLQQMKNNREMHTICGEGFLKLLGELRVSILQDAVLLKMSNPEYPIFEHEIFKSAAFLSFSEESFVCYEQYDATCRVGDESCSATY